MPTNSKHDQEMNNKGIIYLLRFDACCPEDQLRLCLVPCDNAKLYPQEDRISSYKNVKINMAVEQITSCDFLSLLS